jgi:hypothetical protein
MWPAWRRRGIASALYRLIEADLGRPLVPSRIKSAAGKAFWTTTSNNRRLLTTPSSLEELLAGCLA